MIPETPEILRSAAFVFKGRRFVAAELELIREVVCTCGGLSRQELADTVCELLDWRRPAGGLKTMECRELLERLATKGELRLPALVATKPRGSRTRVARTVGGEGQEAIEGTVRDVAPLSLRLVASAGDRQLWRELVERYYLGHKIPFGAHLRYFIEVSRPVRQVVGCVQASSPAWKMAPRDRWIGWSAEIRERNLQRIVNNSRLLLLPWVRVRNLASSVLSEMARQIPAQWEQLYGVRPLLLETLVDEARFRGTCYRAANWLRLGQTQGRGRMDRYSKRRSAAVVKAIYVYPLHRRARERLRDEG